MADTKTMNTKPTPKAIRNTVDTPTQWGEQPDPRMARLNGGRS